PAVRREDRTARLGAGSEAGSGHDHHRSVWSSTGTPRRVNLWIPANMQVRDVYGQRWPMPARWISQTMRRSSQLGTGDHQVQTPRGAVYIGCSSVRTG